MANLLKGICQKKRWSGRAKVVDWTGEETASKAVMTAVFTSDRPFEVGVAVGVTWCFNEFMFK